MSRKKAVVGAFLVAFALSVVAAGSASAEGWHVNGTELTANQSVALSTTAQIDTDALLLISTTPEIVILCGGSLLTGENPEIIGKNTGKAKKLTFTGCLTRSPEKCPLSKTTIPTEPIEALAMKGTGVDDKVLFKPQTPPTFAQVPFAEETECALTGNQPIKGSVIVNAPTGQSETAMQAIEGEGSFENNSLEVAGRKAFIDGGKALLLTSTGALWSFR